MKPAHSITLRVKVTPRAATTSIAGELADGTLKIKVAAAPERGKANAALVAFLAEHYHVPPSAIEIIAGHTAPLKLIHISTG